MKYTAILLLLIACNTNQQADVQKRTGNINNKLPDSINNISLVPQAATDTAYSVTNGTVRLTLRETKPGDIGNLGKPLVSITDTLENADTFTGCIVTTKKYNTIELGFFQAPPNVPWLRNIKLLGKEWKTNAGIKTGDDANALRLAYPSAEPAKDGRSTEENGFWIFTSADDKEIKFEVRNNIIKSIELNYILN